jgi:hypothetical protein
VSQDQCILAGTSAAVRTGVDVLDGDLEAVEGARLHKRGEVSEV